MTADIDIVVELWPKHAQQLIDELEPDYVVPHNSMRRAIANEGMFNVIHQETAFKIDCVVRKSTPFQKLAFKRRQKVDFYGAYVYVITAEDLILSKLSWAADSRSEKQFNDVKNLMRNELDTSYIETWAVRLKIQDLYQECLKEIEQ